MREIYDSKLTTAQSPGSLGDQSNDNGIKIDKTRNPTGSQNVIKKQSTSGDTLADGNDTRGANDDKRGFESNKRCCDTDDYNGCTTQPVKSNGAAWQPGYSTDECSGFMAHAKTSKVTDSRSPDKTSDIICNVCEDKGEKIPAFRFCWECEENLCEVCIQEHKRRKATSKHALSEMRPKSQSGNKVICDVCQDDGKDSVAVMMCGVCEEKLCKPCTEQHRKRKATQAHKLTDLSKINTTPPKPMCNVCLEENENRAAVLFCDVCDEHLCQSCVDKHRKRKATASHSLTSSDSLSSGNDDNGNVPYCSPCGSVKKTRPAAIFCPDCDQFFCAFCSNQHRISKISSSHAVISAEQIREHTQNLECECCKLMQKSKTATQYCLDCESKLCEKCLNQHSSFPNTKNHDVVPCFEMVTKRMAERGRCQVCQQNDNLTIGESVCKECKLILCKTCESLHKVAKNTKSHTLVSIDEMAEETDSGLPADNTESNSKPCDKRPSMPKVLDVSTSSITVTWNKPATTSGEIINYDIRFKEEGETK